MTTTVIFITLSGIIFNGITLLIPKRLTRTEIYITSVFVLLLQLIVDIIGDLKLDLYGYFKKGIDLPAFLTFFAVYPAFSTCFLNYFPYKKSIRAKTFYIIFVSVFCLIYEYLSILSGYFYHNGWNYWYSALSYPALVALIAYHLTIVRRIMKKDYE